MNELGKRLMDQLKIPVESGQANKYTVEFRRLTT